MTSLPRPAHAPDVVPLLLSFFVGAVDLSKDWDSGPRQHDVSMTTASLPPRAALAPDVVPLLLFLFVGAVDLSKVWDCGP